MNRTRKIVVTIRVLLSFSLLTLLSVWLGGLKFESDAANVTAGLLAVLMPAVCLVLLGFLPRSRIRAWAVPGFILLSLSCLFTSAVTSFSTSLAVYTVQSRVLLNSTQVVTYFEDSGAWDDGAVIVQQEVPLLPGLLWVKPLSRQECLRDVQIRVVNRHYVECDYPADTVDHGDPSPDAKRDKAWVF